MEFNLLELLENCIGKIKVFLNLNEIMSKILNKKTQKIKVYYVDSKTIKCRKLKNVKDVGINKDIDISSILLLAVRISFSENINIKKCSVYFEPKSMKNEYYLGEYYSNVLTYIHKDYFSESKIIIDEKDDFNLNCFIDNKNKIYIFPICFSKIENSHVKNFSKIIFKFEDYNNKEHIINLEYVENMCNFNYIEGKVVFESK